MRRLVALSSTTKARKLRNSPSCRLDPLALWDSTAPNLAVKKNVEPLPGSLSTHIRPPIMSTMRVQIVRPNPVPPNFLVVELSAWEKALKIACC